MRLKILFWLFKFNPHSEFLKLEKEYDRVRTEVIELKHNFELFQLENQILLAQLEEFKKLKIQEPLKHEPIVTAKLPWKRRQRVLEFEDRTRYAELQKAVNDDIINRQGRGQSA